MHAEPRRHVSAFVSVFVALALVVGGTGAALAAQPEPDKESMPPPPTGAALDQLIAIYGNDPVIEHEQPFGAQVVTHTHWIKAVGDEEWRSFYGATWDDQTNNAIERADDAMYVEAGIDFRVSTIQHWDTWPDTKRNTCDIQTELRADFNLGTNDSLAGYSGNAHLENWYGCASGPDKRGCDSRQPPRQHYTATGVQPLDHHTA